MISRHSRKGREKEHSERGWCRLWSSVWYTDLESGWETDAFSPPPKEVCIFPCMYLSMYIILFELCFYLFSPCAGEIQEFKQELNSLDKSKRKDAVKKVIAGAYYLRYRCDCRS